MDQIQKLQHQVKFWEEAHAQLALSYKKADQCASDREVQIWALQREIKRWKEHTDKLERDLEEALVDNNNLIGKLSKALRLATIMHNSKDCNPGKYEAAYMEIFEMKHPELSEEEPDTITKAQVVEIVNEMARKNPLVYSDVDKFEDIDEKTLKIATEDGHFGHYTVVD